MRRERGQASVELALALPLLALLLLAVVQTGLVVRDQIMVMHAAREAARQVSVSGDAATARDAAQGSGHLDPSRLTVSTSGSTNEGDRVTVTVRYRAPTLVPLIGALVGDVDMEAHATMRVE